MEDAMAYGEVLVLAGINHLECAPGFPAVLADAVLGFFGDRVLCPFVVADGSKEFASMPAESHPMQEGITIRCLIPLLDHMEGDPWEIGDFSRLGERFRCRPKEKTV